MPYCVNILESLEHPIVLSAYGGWVFPRVKHVVIVMIILVILKQFLRHIDTTSAWDARWETTLNGSIGFLDLLELLCVSVLWTICAKLMNEIKGWDLLETIVGPAEVLIVELIGGLVCRGHKAVQASIAHCWWAPSAWLDADKTTAIFGPMLVCHRDNPSPIRGVPNQSIAKLLLLVLLAISWRKDQSATAVTLPQRSLFSSDCHQGVC